MTTTNALGSSTTQNPLAAKASSTGTSAAGGGPNSLTMTDFLTLMTAQLKNQDPLKPTDSSTFLAELSQMSTVQGVASMSTTLSTLSDSLLKSQAVSSASLVGHNIFATSRTMGYSGSPVSGAVQVPAGASAVTLNIANSSGKVVRQLSVPATQGLQTFTWDGTDSSGAPAASGVYSLNATASVGGGSETAPTLLPGTVSSVSIDSAGTGITLNTPQLGAVALSDVSQFD